MGNAHYYNSSYEFTNRDQALWVAALSTLPENEFFMTWTSALLSNDDLCDGPVDELECAFMGAWALVSKLVRVSRELSGKASNAKRYNSFAAKALKVLELA